MLGKVILASGKAIAVVTAVGMVVSPVNTTDVQKETVYNDETTKVVIEATEDTENETSFEYTETSEDVEGDALSNWNTDTAEKYNYVMSIAEDENLTYEEKVKALNDVRAEALEAYKNSESRELKDEWTYVLIEIDYQLHQNQFADWPVNPLANS